MNTFERIINSVKVTITFVQKENRNDKFTFYIVDPKTGEADETLNPQLMALCNNKTVDGSCLDKTAHALFGKIRTIVGNDPLYTVTEVDEKHRKPKTKTEVKWFIKTKKLIESDIESIIPDRGKHQGQNVVSHFFHTERDEVKEVIKN
jgi:hypothetical protein